VLLRLVRDARRLVMYHEQAIENHPLQLYVSALIFSPALSPVRSLFKHEEPRCRRDDNKAARLNSALLMLKKQASVPKVHRPADTNDPSGRARRPGRRPAQAADLQDVRPSLAELEAGRGVYGLSQGDRMALPERWFLLWRGVGTAEGTAGRHTQAPTPWCVAFPSTTRTLAQHS